MIRQYVFHLWTAQPNRNVMNMNKRRKFSNHLCLRIKYIVVSLRKENMQIKYTIAVLLVDSILQQII